MRKYSKAGADRARKNEKAPPGPHAYEACAGFF